MAREKFENKKLTGPIKVACKYDDGTIRYWETDKETVVSRIGAIVNKYAKQGYTLTLRQLHYQLVTRNWIINHDTAYKKLGDILTDCRYAGVIDWSAIEDRGRVPHMPYMVSDALGGLQDAYDTFMMNLQDGQINNVELWTEKDALTGILKPITYEYRIHLVVNKGYGSSSAMYNAYSRAVNALQQGKFFTILYFGDHDPSGLDMVRDIRERLTMMLCNGDKLRTGEFYEQMENWWIDMRHNLYDLISNGYVDERIGHWHDQQINENAVGDAFEIGRIKWYLDNEQLFNVVPIGLTMEQIKEYNLPPNPTKMTDSRSDNYVRRFGKTCWEVDALEPSVLSELVESNIQNLIDMDKFNDMLELQKEEREKIQLFIDKIKDNN